MKTISRYIMTLALLLTAATGAWAQQETLLTYVTATGQSTSSQSPDGIVTVSLNGIGYCDGTYGWLNSGTVTVEASQGYTITQCVFWSFDGTPLTDNMAPFTATIVDGGEGSSYVSTGQAVSYMDGIKYIEVYGYAPAPIEVTPVAEPAANTKQWTFSMPGSDVVLTPLYAPTATWATTGEGQELKTLLPEAAEGVIAGTTAPLIIEGTVANAGTTENPQGLVMYYAAKGTADAAPTAPTLESQWSADVPTAEAYINDEDGATVYVWYYIAGANTPDGETPTADNTFNDSEICAVPLKVTVLSNKFDLALKAANANTIEAGKATVTVGGTAATVTDGKLQGVKMGSEVKVTAKQGYKFRKVEAKKGAGPVAAAFEDGAKFKVGYKWNNSSKTTYLEFTNSGGTYSLTSVSGDNVNNGFNSSTLTVKDGSVLALDVVCQPSGNPKMDDFSAQIEFDATSSTYKYSSKGSNFNGIISVSVNGTDVTDQLSELK